MKQRRKLLTWQVKYSLNPTSDKLPRFETFASTSLLNRNGLKPEGAGPLTGAVVACSAAAYCG